MTEDNKNKGRSPEKENICPKCERVIMEDAPVLTGFCADCSRDL